MVGQRTLPARAEMLSETEGAQKLFSYARQHPVAFRELSFFLLGTRLDGTQEACEQLAKSVPIVRFQPVSRE